MTRRTNAEIEEELDRLVAMLVAHPGGLDSGEIRDEYARAYPNERELTERTLHRRLDGLVGEGRLRAEGVRRWRRYLPVAVGASDSDPTPPDTTTAAQTDGGITVPRTPPRRTEDDAPPAGPLPADDPIPLSPEGEDVRSLVRRPLRDKPTSIRYDETFLRSYMPGTTWYLPEPVRNRLHEMGRTPSSDRPAGTYARHIYERLLIDLAWASSRLEGNEYTRIDTKNLIERKVAAKDKSAKDTQMILNHRKAIELLVEQAEDVGYNRYTFLNLHAALSENLLPDANDEGRLRKHPVGIDGSPFEPLDIPQQIEELFDHMLKTVDLIPNAFEQAFFLMVHLPYMQPFADVNKRTSRLAANLPLIKANLTPLSFVGTSEQAYLEATLGVYEERRIEMLRDVFVVLYERSCERYQAVRRDMAEPDPVRLEYRTQIHSLVAEVVIEGLAPTATAIKRWALEHDVHPTALTAFVEIAMEVIDALHEGSISRYGIRPSQFATWRERVDAAARNSTLA